MCVYLFIINTTSQFSKGIYILNDYYIIII